MAPVRVHVNEFSITMTEFGDEPAGARSFTRAQSAETYDGVKACVLAFYDADGTEVYKTTQVKGDGTYTTFGEFTANLAIGTYKMVALGYNYFDEDKFTLTSLTEVGFTSEKPRDTFCSRRM